MQKHNKKRNIGLLSEFFAKYIANAVVEFRYDDVEKAKALWKKHVAGNKELCKELKVFDMLHKTYLKNRNVANDLLKKAHDIVSEQDQSKLDQAKTMLLHEINHQLNDSDFFNRHIEKEEYQANANIQMLINSWRNPKDTSIFSNTNIFRLQDQVIEQITTKKEPLPPIDYSLLNKTKEDIDQLVINVFKEKVDKKYSKLLSEDQKKLIGWFVFAKDQKEAKKKLTSTIASLREETLKKIEKEFKTNNKKTPTDKLKEAKEYLLGEYYNIENPDEKTISFYLAVCELKNELESEK